mmetsp:Transcript_41231/g.104960  ORF Transcript_41231/g.104960 Transcript_41231/m.104960 type:complete len:311 (-) Transcript_41231:188-1120(-)
MLDMHVSQVRIQPRGFLLVIRPHTLDLHSAVCPQLRRGLHEVLLDLTESGALHPNHLHEPLVEGLEGRLAIPVEVVHPLVHRRVAVGHLQLHGTEVRLRRVGEGGHLGRSVLEDLLADCDQSLGGLRNGLVELRLDALLLLVVLLAMLRHDLADLVVVLLLHSASLGDLGVQVFLNLRDSGVDVRHFLGDPLGHFVLVLLPNRLLHLDLIQPLQLHEVLVQDALLPHVLSLKHVVAIPEVLDLIVDFLELLLDLLLELLQPLQHLLVVRDVLLLDHEAVLPDDVEVGEDADVLGIEPGDLGLQLNYDLVL